ncbi:MAG: hypothetical protein Q8R24_04875 [Legionellaceae bacterium]|nr:hypothetical protein [Legionellaceae bacterium]
MVYKMPGYEIVNFAGVPYATPEEMFYGRFTYVAAHVDNANYNNSQFHLLQRQIFCLEDHNRIFKDNPLGIKQLHDLLSMLRSLEKTIDDDIATIDDDIAMLHCEQAIGRVLRILNRPTDDDSKQAQCYNENIKQTLQLARFLSRHGSTYSSRRLGRLLMGIAIAAAIASVAVIFFTSAPYSIALGCFAGFVGLTGLLVSKYGKVKNIEEVLTDLANNVKPLPENENSIDPEPTAYTSEPDPFMLKAMVLVETALENRPNPSGKQNQSHIRSFSFDVTSVKQTLYNHMRQRLLAGDEEQIRKQLNELDSKNLESNKYMARVAAICDLVMIPVSALNNASDTPTLLSGVATQPYIMQGDSKGAPQQGSWNKNQNQGQLQSDKEFTFVKTNDLYQLSDLDPLGDADPEKALENAYTQYATNTRQKAANKALENAYTQYATNTRQKAVNKASELSFTSGMYATMFGKKAKGTEVLSTNTPTTGAQYETSDLLVTY